MKKVIKWILIITGCCLIFVFLFVCFAFVYSEFFHATTIDTKTSPDGRYTLDFQQIGSPAWPYGPVTAQVTLKDGKKTIEKRKVEVYNDGSSLYVENWNVEWRDDRVVIIIDLGEIDRNETIEFSFD